MSLKISSVSWGRYRRMDLFLFRMENSKGAYVELTNYGASVVSVVVPDKHGHFGNVVLGFPVAEGYIQDNCYMGSTVGRFANRIADARFTLGGTTWHLAPNDGCHSNHGGRSGFNSKIFDFNLTDDSVTFHLLSEDGDEGYPGNLALQVKYTWSEDCELHIAYTAYTDKPTVANFTNHTYFNLKGGKGKILDHVLTIHSDRMLENSKDYIPTGNVVHCGVLNFTDNTISEKLELSEDVLSGVNAYYIIEPPDKGKLRLAAELADKGSGRLLMVYTTYPGVMVYTGDFLKSDIAGHYSYPYRAFDGICLECQYYPDSPNQPLFPSCILIPGQSYSEQISFRFGLM